MWREKGTGDYAVMNLPIADKYALGVDIGGTSTKIALISALGEIVTIHHIPTITQNGSPATYLESLVENCRAILQHAEMEIIGIGISILGPQSDNRTGPFASANAPWLVGINFRALMEDQFGLPVVVNNDLTAHALAEYYFGSGRGIDRLLCMAIGTGIGAGMIINGEPIRLWGGTAGDCGRCVIDPESEFTDGTGVIGSIEALCGVTAIEIMAKQGYERDVPARDVITAAALGEDEIAVSIVRQVGEYLGQGLAIIYPIFFPDRIVLTGGTSEAGSALLEPCRKRFLEIIGSFIDSLKKAAPSIHSDVEIVLSELRGNTGVLGATVELFQMFS